MIPVTPAKAGGAGMGSLNSANIKPTINPVTIERTTIFIKASFDKPLFPFKGKETILHCQLYKSLYDILTMFLYFHDLDLL